MKKLLLLIFLASAGTLMAQPTMVSTSPENKNAIIEEFSGVRCVNCPAGHQALEQILAANPGDVFAVSMHPTNSSYTPPYTGEENFQRAYCDAFYSTPYCGSSRFMPSAFINRREWAPGEKITSRTSWAGSATTIMGESSPVNVAVKGEYLSHVMQLDVTVEVYFTAAVTDPMSLYVVLSEDSLTSTQSGGTSPYNQMHVFREGLTAQWGDSINGTDAADFHTYTFSYNNIPTEYDMNNVHVTAYVYNAANEEVITGHQSEVVDGPVVGIEEEIPVEFVVSPNPSQGQVKIGWTQESGTVGQVSLMNLMGERLWTAPAVTSQGNTGKLSVNFKEMGLSSGLYLLELQVGEQRQVKKLILD